MIAKRKKEKRKKARHRSGKILDSTLIYLGWRVDMYWNGRSRQDDRRTSVLCKDTQIFNIQAMEVPKGF